jgi:hypothetical protein
MRVDLAEDFMTLILETLEASLSQREEAAGGGGGGGAPAKKPKQQKK